MKMKGKHFFYLSVEVDLDKFDLSKTEFDDFKLLTFDEANVLIDQIYQFNKQRISRKAVKFLKEQDLIS